METKDWYKLTFLIESDSEEIIIWKLNELGIFSFSFEYLIKNENKKEVNIWLPIDDWNEDNILKPKILFCGTFNLDINFIMLFSEALISN